MNSITVPLPDNDTRSPRVWKLNIFCELPYEGTCVWNTKYVQYSLFLVSTTVLSVLPYAKGFRPYGLSVAQGKLAEGRDVRRDHQ